MNAPIAVLHLSKFYEVHQKEPGFRRRDLPGKLSQYFVLGSVFIAGILFYASSRFWRYAIRFYSSASS